MNVLLGDISSYKAITIAKFIRKNYPNIRIYSFDSRKFTGKVHTRYIDENFIVEKNDINLFKKIIIKYDIDFFIPVINESLSVFWENKNEFNGTLDYLGDFEGYTILNDKLKLHHLAEKLNVDVPKRYETISEAKFPFIMKPTNLSSAKGVVYVNTKEDIPKEYNFKNIIIQQFVKGAGVGYSFYCKNGRITKGYGHIRLGEYPVSGGSSTYRSLYNDDRMLEISERIVSNLNYTGFAMFEFKLTPEKELYLLEVNPRIWGSINQGLANGVNYFEDFLGVSTVKTIKKKTDLNTYLGPLVYLSLLKYFFKLKFRPIGLFLKNFYKNTPDVNMFLDPKGYLSIVLRKIYNEKEN